MLPPLNSIIFRMHLEALFQITLLHVFLEKRYSYLKDESRTRFLNIICQRGDGNHSASILEQSLRDIKYSCQCASTIKCSDRREMDAHAAQKPQVLQIRY